MYYYGARIYDGQLGRWIQPDNIIPTASQGVLAWDRFSYTKNNPILFNDPSGHDVGCPASNPSCMGLSGYSNGERYVTRQEMAVNACVGASVDEAPTPAKIEQPVTIHAPEPHEYLRAGPPPSATVELKIPNQIKSFLLQRASDMTSIGPVIKSQLAGAIHISPPLLGAGSVFSALGEYYKDDSEPNDIRLKKTAAVGVESSISTIIANGVGIGCGAAGSLLGPFGTVAGYTFGFGIMNNYIMSNFEKFNDREIHGQDWE